MNGSPPRLRHVPALDGLRGLAVLAVLAYHGGMEWARGGHLGVSTFFTLSGFLITSLLLVEREGTGRIGLGAFWARRARRLVPAMLLTFVLIAAVLPSLQGSLPSGLIGDAVASASWSANWRFILEGDSYADLFADPTPFQHFWSLAIEEQFYVAFPLLVAALTAARWRIGRRGLVVALVAGIAASTFQMAALHDPMLDVARPYYGTDARAAELLVGALLACVLVGRQGLRELGTRGRRAVGSLGLVGFAGLVYASVTLGEFDEVLYRGGFLAIALASAAVILAATQTGTVVNRLLSAEPLVRMGWISYGTYLYHWPLFLLLDEDRTGLEGGGLLVVRTAATVSLAALSYVLVEEPIRHGRAPLRLTGLAWANGAVAGVAVVALASGQLPVPVGQDESVPVAAAALGGAPSAPSPIDATAAAPPSSVPDPQAQAAAAGPAPVAAPAPGPDPAQQPGAGDDRPSPTAFDQDPEDAPVNPVPEVPPGALRIAVVGDSVAENLAHGLRIWATGRSDVAVYDASLKACPLSRYGTRRFGDERPFPVNEVCAWWDDPASERARAMASFAPDVVVLHDGFNEMVDRRLEEWGEWRRPGDPRFDRWLIDEYGALVERIAPGATVVAVNAACADWTRHPGFKSFDDADVRIQALNTGVYPQLVGATVADLFTRVCPAGRFQEEVEGVADARPDGFHFRDEASQALARNWLGPLVVDAHEAAALLSTG